MAASERFDALGNISPGECACLFIGRSDLVETLQERLALLEAADR